MSSTAVDKCVIAFGQRGGYLFECSSKRYSGRLPNAVAARFRDQTAAHTFCLALGKGESYVLTYRGKDSLQYLRTSGLPDSLEKWLRERDGSKVLVRELDQLQVALGPYNESYYAMDGKTSACENLPMDLKAALNENQNGDGTWKTSARPRLVALGVDGNYIMITARNGGVWNLGRYPALKQLVETLSRQTGGFASIAQITLNAYRIDSYAVVMRGGIIEFNNTMPHANLSTETIKAALKDDVETEKALEKMKQEAEEEKNRLRQANIQARRLQQQREQAQRQAERRMLQTQRQSEMQMLQMQQQAELQMLQNALAMNMMMNSWNNFGFNF